MNGGFVGLGSLIRSSVQAPSLQETRHHHGKALLQVFISRVGLTKQDNVVFVVYTSLSLMGKSQLLTIFIHWAM